METPGTNLTKVVEDLSSNTDDPAIRRALYLPSAEIIGKIWARDLENLHRSVREKRLENLGAQVDRAIEMNGQERLDEIAATPEFQQWASGVADVDPADKDLLDIWQAALLALQKGEVRRLRILKIVKQLQPDEAAAFLAIAKVSRTDDIDIDEYNKRFIEVGLIKSLQERIFERGLRSPVVMAASIIFTTIAMTFLISQPPFYEIFSKGQSQQTLEIMPTMLIGVAVMMLMMGSVSIASITRKIALTRDGEELKRLVEKIFLAERRATGELRTTESQ